MKSIHVPRVNARYWTAITLASVFGTNLGDLYAHESGLSIGTGLAVLVVVSVFAMLAERRDFAKHEAWYWLVIIIVRTGATNIADFLAFRVRVPPIALGLGLVILLAVLGLATHRVESKEDAAAALHSPPKTTVIYWSAMLTAGVLGTVLGDDASHLLGEGRASIGLGALLMVSLLLRRGSVRVMTYWAVLAIARTAGTAIGDFLAENKQLGIGLPLSTLITGLTLIAILAAWRAQARATTSHQ